MDDLSHYADASFDLVVALGVYHTAQSRAEWEAALAETARVLKPGATLLAAVFSPRTDKTGAGITEVAGEPHLFDGLPSGRHYLLEGEVLDADMARHGLTPIVATETVTVPLERGRRVTVNALYRKAILSTNSSK
jgi:SAM-dependent methyltransferase